MVRRIGIDAYNRLRTGTRLQTYARLTAFGWLVLSGIFSLVGHLPSGSYILIFVFTIFAVVPACTVTFVLGVRATRQAQKLAADYLNADEYIQVKRISSYTLNGGPELFDRFLMNAGIPLPDGVEPRSGQPAPPPSVPPPARRSGGSAWASIRDAVPRRVWIISLSGVAVIGVGVVLDLVVLFVVGAALMHSYVRAVRRRD